MRETSVSDRKKFVEYSVALGVEYLSRFRRSGRVGSAFSDMPVKEGPVRRSG